MGYLLLSLLVLVRGTWRATLPAVAATQAATRTPATPALTPAVDTGEGGGEAATGGGAAWRAVHRYAWAVPLLVVAYQAPPVPAQCTLVLRTTLMTPVPSATIPTTTTYYLRTTLTVTRRRLCPTSACSRWGARERARA